MDIARCNPIEQKLKLIVLLAESIRVSLKNIGLIILYMMILYFFLCKDWNSFLNFLFLSVRIKSNYFDLIK